MRLTPDLQKKALAVGGFVALAAGILYYQLSDDSPAPRPQQPPGGAYHSILWFPGSKGTARECRNGIHAAGSDPEDGGDAGYGTAGLLWNRAQYLFRDFSAG